MLKPPYVPQNLSCLIIKKIFIIFLFIIFSSSFSLAKNNGKITVKEVEDLLNPERIYKIDLFLHSFVDLIFIFDCALMFFTTYTNRHGQEIGDHYHIMLNYVLSWGFIFDMLSLLGNTYFKSMYAGFMYFTLFKAVRITRISGMIRRSS